MKRFTIILYSISVLLVLSSCDEKEKTITNDITFEKDDIVLSSLEQSLTVKVKTTSDFSVTSNCEWLSVEKNFSGTESTIHLTIKENKDSLHARKGTILLESLSNDARGILYITQTCKSYIRLLSSTQHFSSKQQDISIIVNSNSNYDVIVSEDASDWITIVNTKSTNDSIILVSVSQNDTYKRRIATILFKNENNNTQETITILQDEGFQSLNLLLEHNNSCVPRRYRTSIFYDALVATHLSDSLANFYDERYPTPGYDSTFACLQLTGIVAIQYETGYETGTQAQRVVWPTERLFKYTLFAVPDTILESVYNIHNLNELEDFAKKVYNDPAHINDAPWLTTSPLYKLISYHILPFWANYDEFNFTNEEILKDTRYPEHIDVQDFYETMHPYAIMRISTPYDKKAGPDKQKIFINRKGTVSDGNLTHRGIRIWDPKEYADQKIQTDNALNGGYYFVDSLLLFDQHTKDALNTRLRFCATTLSPDFMNTVRRDRMRTNDLPTTFAVTAFKNGYCRNFSATNQTMFVVRYQDKGWGLFNHDAMTIRGNYDLILRLPPVPESGTYEIRIDGNALGETAPKRDRGYVQFYFIEGNGSPVPCGPPFNSGLRPEDPSIGFITDEDLKKNKSQVDGQAAIIANDQLMRERGYMKAPASAVDGSDVNFRDNRGCFRKIICEKYMEVGKDYYLRFEKKDDLETNITFSILEIVPYSIYSGINGPEDIY